MAPIVGNGRDGRSGGLPPELRGASVLRGRSLVGRVKTSSLLAPELCGEQGRASHPLYRPPGDGGAAERDHQPVPEEGQYLRGPLERTVFDLPSWSDLTSGQRSGSEAGGPGTGREAEEGGEEGPVDGQPEGTRLGKEWKMPLPLLDTL